MQREDLDLTRRLFAVALAKLEDSTSIATRGQSSKRPSNALPGEARRLRDAGRQICALADAVLAITHPVERPARPRRRKSR